jgi:hypothetical protein
MRTTVGHPFTAVGPERAVVSGTHHAGSSASRLPGLARAVTGGIVPPTGARFIIGRLPLPERSTRVAEVAA